MIHCALILYYLLIAYDYILIANIILSWFPRLRNFKIFNIIGKIGDWYLEPFSGVLVLGILDFTPLIGFALYDGLVYAIAYLL